LVSDGDRCRLGGSSMDSVIASFQPPHIVHHDDGCSRRAWVAGLLSAKPPATPPIDHVDVPDF
jgi:hypothetical protein